jgi:hypothetical protein
MLRPWIGLVLCGIASLAGPVAAHHSFAVYYIEGDTMEIDGEIVEFQYKNPHSWLHVVAQDAFGAQKIYSAEWTSTSQLERIGVTKNTLHAGDRVHLWVSPSRNPQENRVRLKRIERSSDGFKWGQNRNDTR